MIDIQGSDTPDSESHGSNNQGSTTSAVRRSALTPLAIDKVSFSYAKKKILNDISFQINPGSFSVLLGANGAGKTTLFSLITRLYSPSSGQIVVFGNDLNKNSGQALSRLGVVFQNPTLDQDLSIAQNLKYYSSLYGISKQKTRQILNDQFPKYLPECQLEQKIHQLSGGQKRRVELMRSLMHQPDLLLLDEPTVGLDINSREAFISHVRALCTDEGIGVLWATHLIDEVGENDDVIVLHQSKILATAKVKSLIETHAAESISDVYLQLTGVQSVSESVKQSAGAGAGS